MISWEFSAVFLLWLLVCGNHCLKRKTLVDYLDTCLDGRYHKKIPGSEWSLFHRCSPWKKRSCCHRNTTKIMQTPGKKWYNFNWDHCHKLSTKCRHHFFQDLCFYECSPNTGPWLVEVKMKIRKEKFFHVPLCENECLLWWEDCKEDFTCKENWGRGFNWTTGTNTCPTNTSCKPFQEIFQNAVNFCEKIWDHSWKVVPDTEPCMRLWFDMDRENPNNKVALQRALLLVSGVHNFKHSSFLLALWLLLYLFS